MTTRHIGLCLVLASILATAPVVAGSGTIAPGSNGNAIEDELASTWNTDWFCSKRPQTLYAWQNTGPCVGRQASLAATVTSGGGTTNVSHTYSYNLACVGGVIQQTMQFDGGAITPINNGTFVFNLSGGDTIQLVTTEGLVQVSAPAIGRTAVIVAIVAFGIGLLWLLRRR